MDTYICVTEDDVRKAIELGCTSLFVLNPGVRYNPPVVHRYEIELQFQLMTLPFIVKEGDFIV